MKARKTTGGASVDSGPPVGKATFFVFPFGSVCRLTTLGQADHLGTWLGFPRFHPSLSLPPRGRERFFVFKLGLRLFTNLEGTTMSYVVRTGCPGHAPDASLATWYRPGRRMLYL